MPKYLNTRPALGFGHRRRRRWPLSGAALALGMAVLFTSMMPAKADSATPRFRTLAPGQKPLLPVPVKVNVVLVGYQPNTVDMSRILGQLPASGNPVITARAYYYGVVENVGIQYQYRYQARYAGRSFDDAFFKYLASAGAVLSPSYWQVQYNQQVHHTMNVGPEVRYIDGRATERWLEANAGRRLGLRSTENTVFLINWYGRPDFQFHNYTNVTTPDPDTGAIFGYSSHSLTSEWGGSSGPTWFFDVSAGPNWNDESWDVDDADLTGDGILDYRIPPVWEYGNTTGYRPFTDLSGDLGKVVRYVALDLLFTTSPFYDPATTVPGPDGHKQIALDIFEGDSSRNGLNDVRPDLLKAAHQALEPYYTVDTKVTDLPLSGGPKEALDIATRSVQAPGCWTPFGTPDAELFCFFSANKAQYFPPSGQDSVIPAAGYTVAQDAQTALGYLGLTDFDWATGKQSFIYAIDPPKGHSPIGYTALTTHEAGHYVGLSHPHDGWDPGSNSLVEPDRATAFAWMGDASDTVMSYLNGPLGFDIFDQTNLARFQVGRLLTLADQDVAAIATRPSSHRVDVLLSQADDQFTAATRALQTGDWLTAASDAVAGYRDIQRADLMVGVAPLTAKAAAVAGPLVHHGTIEKPHP